MPLHGLLEVAEPSLGNGIMKGTFLGQESIHAAFGVAFQALGPCGLGEFTFCALPTRGSFRAVAGSLNGNGGKALTFKDSKVKFSRGTFNLS